MNLTKEQIEFLDEVCYRREYWKLNSNGEVDVDGGVTMGFLNLTEIPVKFGSVSSYFHCYNNQLTSLEGCPTSVGEGFYCYNNQLTSLEFAPTSVGGEFYCSNNQLTNYFKTIKEEDFPHWEKLDWGWVLDGHPFLINICKKYLLKDDLKYYLDNYPQTEIYLE